MQDIIYVKPMNTMSKIKIVGFFKQKRVFFFYLKYCLKLKKETHNITFITYCSKKWNGWVQKWSQHPNPQTLVVSLCLPSPATQKGGFSESAEYWELTFPDPLQSTNQSLLCMHLPFSCCEVEEGAAAHWQSGEHSQGFLKIRGAPLKMGENNIYLVQKETCWSEKKKLLLSHGEIYCFVFENISHTFYDCIIITVIIERCIFAFASAFD